MISDIADLIVELSKERKTDDPVRAIYSVYMELSREIGRRMKQATKIRIKPNIESIIPERRLKRAITY